MRKLILVMGLVVVAFACSEQAGQMLVDGGQMMMDAGNGMVPDAGAQPGDLRVECDGDSDLAEVAASELPGVFNAYLCTEAEEGISNVIGGPETENPVCIIASPGVMEDGRYLFDCSRGNAGYSGSGIQVPEPRHIRIVR